MQFQKDVGRECGPCNACCKPFPVPEVGKLDSRTLCVHASENGCCIYARRPEACQLYACAWLNGLGDMTYRPDRLGVMIDIMDMNVAGKEFGVLHLWETRMRAFGQKKIQAFIKVNLDAKFVIATHRLENDGSYTHDVDISTLDFTEEERTIFYQKYYQYVPC